MSDAVKPKKILYFLLVLLLLPLIFSCTKSKENASEEKIFSIAVFIPGFVEGSPNYEMLVEGSRRAVSESKSSVMEVVEAGFNQAEWEDKLNSLAATDKYDLIVTSNPAMPDICASVARSFPDQKFVVIDGYLEGHPQIYTVIFNQVEQGYLIGYMGGLVTGSEMPGANPQLKVGLIAGQQYPVMDRAIRPGFEMGLKAADPGIEMDFRVVGNWYDAGKAASLAESMFDGGVDIILVIAGSAAQGVLKTARDRGRYVLWFDSNGYSLAPGTVVGSSAIKLDRITYETLQAAIRNRLSYGAASKLGIQDGYVEFITDDDNFMDSVPPALQEKMKELMTSFQSGSIGFDMPDF